MAQSASIREHDPVIPRLPSQASILQLLYLTHRSWKWYFSILREEAEERLDLVFGGHIDNCRLRNNVMCCKNMSLPVYNTINACLETQLPPARQQLGGCCGLIDRRNAG